MVLNFDHIVGVCFFIPLTRYKAGSMEWQKTINITQESGSPTVTTIRTASEIQNNGREVFLLKWRWKYVLLVLKWRWNSIPASLEFKKSSKQIMNIYDKLKYIDNRYANLFNCNIFKSENEMCARTSICAYDQKNIPSHKRSLFVYSKH